MKIFAITLLVIFSFTLHLYSDNNKYGIIPLPQQMKPENGTFTLSKNTGIYRKGRSRHFAHINTVQCTVKRCVWF